MEKGGVFVLGGGMGKVSGDEFLLLTSASVSLSP